MDISFSSQTITTYAQGYEHHHKQVLIVWVFAGGFGWVFFVFSFLVFLLYNAGILRGALPFIDITYQKIKKKL
jgi:hypothetical protein